jgi:hypothetical protein
MEGILVVRNRQLRPMLDFAAKHNARATKKTSSLEGLNNLMEDYHSMGGWGATGGYEETDVWRRDPIE